MWISDALSHAYRNTTEFVQHDKSLVCSIEEVDHSENLSIARTDSLNSDARQQMMPSCKV